MVLHPPVWPSIAAFQADLYISPTFDLFLFFVSIAYRFRWLTLVICFKVQTLVELVSQSLAFLLRLACLKIFLIIAYLRRLLFFLFELACLERFNVAYLRVINIIKLCVDFFDAHREDQPIFFHKYFICVRIPHSLLEVLTFYGFMIQAFLRNSLDLLHSCSNATRIIHFLCF